MKKFIQITTSITLALLLPTQIYNVVTDIGRSSEPKTSEAPKPTTPPIEDINLNRRSTPTSSTTAPRTSTERNVLTEALQKLIEDTIRRHESLSSIPSEQLALYLETNKAESGKRAFQLEIIEELGKDPQKVITHAQEIANAFDRFLASSTAGSTNVRTLTDKQVAKLTAMAETMLQNKQGTATAGLMIINQLMRRPEFIVKPETLVLIKQGTFAKNNQQATQEAVTKFIENMLKKNSLSATDLVALVERANTIGVAKAKINEWDKRIDALVDTIRPEDIQKIESKKITELGTTIQKIMDRSPEKGLMLLAKTMENLPITAEFIPELTYMYNLLLMGIKQVKPEQFKILLSMMPTIARLEKGVALLENTYQGNLKALKDTYIKLVKQNKRAANDITSYITTYIDDKAKNVETLLTAAQLTEIAKQEFGITDRNEAYNIWLAKIADKAYVLNNNALGILAKAKTASAIETQLNDIAILVNLMRVNTNQYAPTALGKLISGLDEQSRIFEIITTNIRQQRNVKAIKEAYVALQKDLAERINLLFSAF